MRSLRPHRLWLTIFAFALLILFGSRPAIEYAQNRAAAGFEATKAAEVKTSRDLQQLRDDVAAARKLRSQMDREHADRILAQTDRLKCAEMLEHEADAAKLSHFTYNISPEEHLTLTLDGEKHLLASSAVALAGDAHDDITVYDFIDRVEHVLPGRARLQHLTIERAQTPLSNMANVHFEAAFDWLSNGTVQTVATAP